MSVPVSPTPEPRRTVGSLGSQQVGTRLTLQLPDFEVTGLLTHIHFEQPITTAQEAEGVRCYIRLASSDEYSWSNTVPASTVWWEEA